MILLATLLAAATVAEEPKIDCANPMAQLAMTICAGRDFKTADTEMNAQWESTAAVMKRRDKDLDRKRDTRPGYFETLLAGQRAWLTYREQHCRSEGYTMRGGSAEPMVNSNCKTKLTRARIAQLKDLTQEY